MLLKGLYVCKRNFFWNRWAIGGPLEEEEVRQQLGAGWLFALQGNAQTRSPESDERNRWGGTQQGFEAFFLGFLCIGKFLKSKQKE